MRISAEPGHRDNNPACSHAKVYLDGALLRYCVTADEEAGTAECYALDEHGHIVTACGQPQFETLRGQVKIDLTDCTYPAEYVGFDAWMRARTDRAHAEYMARHAAGGVDYSKRHARGGFVDGVRLVGEAA